MNYSFPKSRRILKRKFFKEIASLRKRFSGKLISINYRYSDAPKIGITVTRQYGNAVKRNYFKRLVREAFRLNQHQLPPFEMIILPRKDAGEISLESITNDFMNFCGSHAQSSATKSR